MNIDANMNNTVQQHALWEIKNNKLCRNHHQNY